MSNLSEMNIRERALAQADQSYTGSENVTTEMLLARAKKFEVYLKGEHQKEETTDGK